MLWDLIQVADVVAMLQGVDEMERMNVSDIKEELKSLKALLLNRFINSDYFTGDTVITGYILFENLQI